MAIHCPECGFVNAEGANYCQKCGAYLSRPDGKDEPTTMTYTVDESGEMHQVDIEEMVEKAGAALVIRAGGGRAGESFTLDDDKVSLNGTYVNRRRIESHALVDGDEIQIGKYKLSYLEK